jgi:N-acetylmuramoyl-L-alanine amidase
MTMTRKLTAAMIAAIMAMTMTTCVAFAEDAPDDMTGSKTTCEAPVIKVKEKGPALKVSWEEVKGAQSYEVYRSYSSEKRGKLLKMVTDKHSYKDKKVASGKTAYYRVRVRMKNGSASDYSKPVSGRIFRVYIETGHGTNINGVWDPGCTWGKYQEAKLMIPICKSMAKQLRKRGVYVYTDAEDGNNRNIRWVLNNLRSRRVSVLVNVHCDDQDNPKGTLPLYRYKEQKKLAKCLNDAVHKKVEIEDRGLEKRKDLMTLNETKDYCVACLFETGNIKKDNKILRKKYKAYGKGLAMGVCDYLGVEW